MPSASLVDRFVELLNAADEKGLLALMLDNAPLDNVGVGSEWGREGTPRRTIAGTRPLLRARVVAWRCVLSARVDKRSLSRFWVGAHSPTLASGLSGRQPRSRSIRGLEADAIAHDAPAGDLNAFGYPFSTIERAAPPENSQDTGLKLKDLSQLDRLAARLAALEREAAEDPDDKAGWFGAEWQGKFLAYDGPYEGLRAIEDEVFDSTMQTALESAGYHVVMVTAQQLAGARSRRFRLIQLTDRKLWRRRVANAELLLVARPKE